MAIRTGIVGLGAMGVWHAELVRKVPGFRLHSVCDITPERLKLASEQYKCLTYESLREFVRDPDLDLAVIATPSHAHAKPAIDALSAGKHVLCEKPLARTEAEAARMFAAAQKAGRILMTFQNRRGDPDFQTVQKVVRGGRLGALHDIRIMRWWYSSIMRTFGVDTYRPGWRAEAAFGGGTLLDFGAHYIDQVLLLVDEPVTSIYGHLSARRWTSDADDHFLAILQTAGGATIHVEYSQHAHVPVRVEWAITGEKAGFRFREKESAIYTHSANGQEKERPVKNARVDWSLPYRNLKEVIAGRASLTITPRQTLRLMRVLDAIRRSAKSGRSIAFDDKHAPQSASNPRRRKK